MITNNSREKLRTSYFLGGLVLSLIVVISLFQWTSQKALTEMSAPVDVAINDGLVIPITKQQIKMEAAPKKLTHPKVMPDDFIEPVKLLVDMPKETYQGLGEEPVEIGIEPGLEEVEPIEMVFLENIAVPAGCENLSSKEEKVQCMNAWIRNYLQTNLSYPEKARIRHLEDKVFLTFVIAPDGSIEQVEVLRGEYDILNEEAMRVLQQMPDWIAARQFMRNVPMRMRIPVDFRTR